MTSVIVGFCLIGSYVCVATLAIMVYRGLFIDRKIRANLYVTGENEAYIGLYDKDLYYDFHNGQIIYVKLIDLRGKV